MIVNAADNENLATESAHEGPATRYALARILALWLVPLLFSCQARDNNAEKSPGNTDDRPTVRLDSTENSELGGETSNPTPTPTSTDELERMPSDPVDRFQATATIPFESVGLVQPKLQADEDKDGWDVEKFNEAAGEVLHRLDSLIKEPDAVDSRTLSALVSPSLRCTPLRPSQMFTAFEDSSFRVSRPVGELPVPAAERTWQLGANGFSTALAALLKPWHGGEPPRAKFKIFRVQIRDNTAVSYVRLELSGRMAEGLHSIVTEWQCRWQVPAASAPLLDEIRLSGFEETLGRGPSILFADCTEAVLGGTEGYREQLAYGLDHWLDRIELRFYVDASGWEGLAVGDVNGDGREDVYLCQPGGLPNRLFLQQPDGTAVDATETANVGWLDQTQAALLVDLDNDADQDLVLGTTWGIIFCGNDGTGRFEFKAAKLMPEGTPFSLSAADFDADGDLDVYVCAYSLRPRDIEHTAPARPMPYHDANNGARNALFRNDRDWRFRDVAAAVGLDHNNHRFSFTAAWEDYDNDGDLDLYVANDYGRNNLYRFDRSTGQFHDVAPDAGVEDISTGMSASWGDYDNDGWMDLYVANMWSSAGNRIAYQRRFHSGADHDTLAELRRHARGNSLFRNAGDGRFHDVSVEAGVTMGRWSWGSLFTDINSDGRQDLVVTNGYITQEDTGDL